MKILAAIKREEKKVRKQLAKLQNQLNGLASGQNTFAIVSPTTATGWLPRSSEFANERPRRRRVPITLKYSGLTAM